MPLYEYACRDCDHAFETLVYDDAEKVECPKCESVRLERLMSLPGVGRSTGNLPMSSSCGDPSLPPCGAPWCQRTGK